MRYDEQNKILHVDVREAVSCARRGISGYTIPDSEEPSHTGFALPPEYSDDEAISLDMRAEADGIEFMVHGTILRATVNEIHVLCPVEELKEIKRKESKKQFRGEAFMLGAMLANERYGRRVDAGMALAIHMVCYARSSREIDIVSETVPIRKLYDFFDKCMSALPNAGRAEIERVTERLPSMKTVKFPYGKPRSGQDEFIRTAYRSLSRGSVLYATAPTGTGKTVSALFPAIRALGNGKCEKVFYLTPKTTTAQSAKECIARLCESGARIRAVILTAKEKLCLHNHLCRKSYTECPTFKKGDMNAAVMALFKSNIPTVSPSDILEFAKRFFVCPHELSLTYSELCDVIICDFNYLFDPGAYIRRFFSVGGDFAFLIDEAHNLAERAREMYSAEISLADLESAYTLGPLSNINKASEAAAGIFRACLKKMLKDEVRRGSDGSDHSAYHSRELPGELYGIFEKLILVGEDELKANFSAKDNEKDLRISFIREYLHKIKKFYSAMCRFDESFEFFAFMDGDELRAKIFCLDTGNVIAERLHLGKSAVIFSGTLSPISYYRSVLGSDRSSSVLEVNSPFDNEQLSVSVMNKITTRYSEREDSLLAICRVIAATLSAKRGNYMIFSPSFAYSQALCNAFKRKYPKINVMLQTPNMSAEEKEKFLAAFSKEDDSYLAAFCVMGGIYSEGIDLTGDKLIGAIIVGIGMPTLSFEREAIAAYYEEKLESGVQYAYLYPGMNRVLQAAGRVIRTETDKGVIVLIDDRFDDPIYKKAAPALWRGMQFLSDPHELKDRLDKFWNKQI